MRRSLRKSRWLSIGGMILALLQARSLTAEEQVAVGEAEPAAKRFMRIVRDNEQRPLALQTSIDRYVSENGQTVVDLIGAVHIGDQQYYEQLNEEFRKYDAVLYELVAPAGTRVPKGGRETTGNPIAMMQQMAQSMLGLQAQLDHVDYAAANFVHADMSPAEMAEKMRERGDTPLTFALSAAADIFRQANLRAEEMAERQRQRKQLGENTAESSDPLDMFSMLTEANSGAKLKVQLAEQFESMGGALDGGLGVTLNRAVVKDRNAAAMKVFQQRLAAGDQKLAIFYGAAHLSDLEDRLIRDFGLHHLETRWLTAWDLTAKTAKTPSPLQLMLRC